jgi:hypothetical protein
MHERDDPNWHTPDVRDGLTRLERVVLYVLADAQRELNGRAVPTAMLYGRVLEYVNLGEAELQACLSGLAARVSDNKQSPRVRVDGQFARVEG